MPKEINYKKKKKDSPLNEILGIVLIGLSVCFLVSFLSHDALDITRIKEGHEAPRNLCGVFGVYLSSIPIQIVGSFSCYLVPLFLFFFGVRSLRDTLRMSASSIVGMLLLVISLPVFFSLLFERHTFYAGGWIGASISPLLKAYFSLFSYFMSAVFVLIGTILCFEISLRSLFGFTKRCITKKHLPLVVINNKEKREINKQNSTDHKQDTFKEEQKTHPAYQPPPLELLCDPVLLSEEELILDMKAKARLLEQTLSDFGIEAKVLQVNVGPSITRYDLQPASGVKVSSIVALSDDIALSLATPSVRIEAPVPGKQVLGIEVPNRQTSTVYLKEILSSKSFINSKAKLPVALGKDISGEPVVVDLEAMPHLLIAGATGSGKSVCINTIVVSLLYKLSPLEVKFLMIDPKRVELAIFNGIPHLIAPVITDIRKAASSLRWLVDQMEERYRLFAVTSARNIDNYNEKIEEKLPYIIMIIDELADLMVVASAECEEAITRLSQMARAVGIHLILATQRPSVDVITGIIKANLTCRIAFQVASKVDSRTIIDMNGAEKLLGRGDMLFLSKAFAKPIRIQGSYVSQEEIEKITEFIKRNYASDLKQEDVVELFDEDKAKDPPTQDPLFNQAIRLVVLNNQASASMLQRKLKIGYNRAARLIDKMEEMGIVSSYIPNKGREVLVSENYLNED